MYLLCYMHALVQTCQCWFDTVRDRDSPFVRDTDLPFVRDTDLPFVCDTDLPTAGLQPSTISQPNSLT